jgi:chromosome segregation ATPase
MTTDPRQLFADARRHDTDFECDHVLTPLADAGDALIAERDAAKRAVVDVAEDLNNCEGDRETAWHELARLKAERDALKANFAAAVENENELRREVIPRLGADNRRLRAALLTWKHKHGMASLAWKCQECEACGDAALITECPPT